MTTKALHLFAVLLACGVVCSAAQSAPRLKKKTVAARTAEQNTASGPAYAQHEDAMAAASDIANRRDLSLQWVRRAIAQAHYSPQIAKLILPPPAGIAKNWRLYRSRFVEPIRIKAGVKFWQENRDSLARAQQQTGVPPEIIVGIIGVESIYGQKMGGFRVIDALTTLAFDFPANHPRALERSTFFRAELEQFLSLAHRTGIDPLTPLGSYAGAMGMSQFMPSSWVKYAIDFDGDSKIDLFDSPSDAIGSVANYFKAFHWQPGMPTHYPLRFDDSRLDLDGLLSNDILPTFTVLGLASRGVMLDDDALKHTGPMALIELQNGVDPPSYFVGTENFYAITRYNWSSYYAMAVIELGRAVARAMKP